MMHTLDHAANRRRILQHTAAAHLVEPQADEGAALAILATDRAPDLGHFDLRLLARRLLVSHFKYSRSRPDYSRASAPSARLPRMSLTLRPRRAATERGELLRVSASNAALIMLCGLEVPTDFATTSATPSASKMARIGPPAMMPVPGTAARSTTRPEPKCPFTSWCRVRPSRSGTRN